MLGGEAKPRTVPVCAEKGPEPSHGDANPGGPVSFLSVPRVSGLFVLELTMCLSPPVQPCFLTPLQTASDGWVLCVATLLSVDSVEADGKSQPSVTTPFVSSGASSKGLMSGPGTVCWVRCLDSK